MRLSAGLTPELCNEINNMNYRIHYLTEEDNSIARGNWKQIRYLHKHELQAHKIRAETLYSDIDCKEQS